MSTDETPGKFKHRLLGDLEILFLEALEERKFSDMGDVQQFLNDLYDTVESDWDLQQLLDEQTANPDRQ